MADLYLLSTTQIRRIEGYFPLSYGVVRVGDRRIVSAIFRNLEWIAPALPQAKELLIDKGYDAD